jgi:predicted transglutaminase-like cysteine proteinase
MTRHGARYCVRGLGFLLALALALLVPLRPPAALAGSAPAKIEAISFIDDITSDKNTARLFDMDTELLAGGNISEKWNHAKTEIARDREAVDRCRTNNVCSADARKLLDLSAAGAGRTGRARVGLINRAVDLAIGPASDEAQWGAADRWSAPFETLRSSRGDCEDYAIVKYLALTEAGFSRDDVKIVILKNAFPTEDHAVVAARVDGQWLILDNRTLTLVRDVDLIRATPQLVLDHTGVKRFVWKSRDRRGNAI